MTGYTFEEITKSTPERSLIIHPRGYGGRDTTGRITVRHRGGGNRRYVRIIDFKREKHNIPAKVAAIEYDPNRTARLALLFYADGVKRYIVAPLGVQVGDTLILDACRNPAWQLPPPFRYSGWHPGARARITGRPGAQLVRSAGGSAQVLAKESEYAQIRLPSGEVRLIRQTCYATIGQVGNLTITISSWARPVANAIWASARRYVVLPCPARPPAWWW